MISDYYLLFFYVSLTVRLSITLANDQLDAQILNTFITILYMFMFSSNILLILRRSNCINTAGAMLMYFRLGLCILVINLYIIIGSLILCAEISRRLKLVSLGSVITLIGVVTGEKRAVWFERVRADVAIGNSS